MGDESMHQARSTVLRLRGLPFQATEVDIEEFFDGYNLKNCQLCKRNGRATGEAYVQLESELLAGKALHDLNCKYVGRRYIEIFEALETDIALNAESRAIVGFVLRLRGLPYSASRMDVETFFDGLEICKGEEGVVFSVTSIGKPTGEAYVEFITEIDQQEAMKKHKQHIGTRYVEIFKSTKADLLQALQQNRFYKEQAQKRQLLIQTMVGVPPPPPPPQSQLSHPIQVSMDMHRRSSSAYELHVDDVSDVLKGLRVGSSRHPSGLILSHGGPGPPPPPPLPHFQGPISYETNPNFQTSVTRQGPYLDPRYFIPEQMASRPSTLSGNIYSRNGVGLRSAYDTNPGQAQGVMPRHEMLIGHQPYVIRSPQHVIQQPPMMFGYQNPTSWMTGNEVTRHASVNHGINPLPLQHSLSSPPFEGMGNGYVYVKETVGADGDGSHRSGGGSPVVITSTSSSVSGMVRPSGSPSSHANAYRSSNPSLSPATTFPDILEGEDSLDLVGTNSPSRKNPGDQVSP